MKTRLFIFSTLCLAVSCLGSASIAMAQSVTGGGVFIGDPDDVQVSISVRARTGPEGSVQFAGGLAGVVIGKVVDLCVGEQVANAAIVVTQVTQSTAEGFPIGSFVPWVFQDNGRTGDRFGAFAGVFDEFISCIPWDVVDLLENGAARGNVLTLTHGNIDITP
jgi:hypothetical protein